MTSFQALCVYCGSRPGRGPLFTQGAREFGQILAKRGITMVYGAGSTGIMGTMANAVLDAGGDVIGVIPRGLMHSEKDHANLTELHVVDTMHQRKAKMIELSQGFVALPGGFGTLDEIFEVLTWSQLGLHPHPCGFLNINQYWSPLKAMVDHIAQEQFIDAAHTSFVHFNEDPELLLDTMAHFKRDAPVIWKEPSP